MPNFQTIVNQASHHFLKGSLAVACERWWYFKMNFWVYFLLVTTLGQAYAGALIKPEEAHLAEDDPRLNEISGEILEKKMIPNLLRLWELGLTSKKPGLDEVGIIKKQKTNMEDFEASSESSEILDSDSIEIYPGSSESTSLSSEDIFPPVGYPAVVLDVNPAEKNPTFISRLLH
ncbi:unnamed protein product [Allacma fusca]|uniref:Uncharacterized protein n=1 Tax=Allacma fusca TaxID=39272 RepID=A0A8J2LIG1_9HEXA|nr:unnamed protein product [Allacma fusca]